MHTSQRVLWNVFSGSMFVFFYIINKFSCLCSAVCVQLFVNLDKTVQLLLKKKQINVYAISWCTAFDDMAAK